MGEVIRTLGGLGGGFLGNLVGHADEGKSTGRSLGAAISRWMGTGDYTVKVNSLITGSPAIPMMHNSGQSIIVRHKEFVCDIIGGTGAPSNYSIAKTFALNPGLATSFPWLSSVAQQYQEYSWKGIVYHFVSTSGQSVSSTNTALGSVMMHTDYRVTAPSPANKIELLNEYFASDAKPSESFCHPIECDPKENPYNVQYVRAGAVPAGEDPKTYDLGKVNIATQGLPSASINTGELWVTYEVELKKPQLTGGVTLGSHYQGTTGIDTTHICGTSPIVKSNTLGVTFNGVDTFTLPAGLTGNYIAIAAARGNLNDAPAPALTNAGSLNWSAAGSWLAYAPNAGTNEQAVSIALFTISSANVPTTLKYTYATLLGTATDFIVMRLPNDFV
jgi:hypothetical protein